MLLLEYKQLFKLFIGNIFSKVDLLTISMYKTWLDSEKIIQRTI
jgi:hypothetical protein